MPLIPIREARMSSIAAFIDAIHPAFLDGDPLAQAKANETENVGLVRGMYEAIARGDFAAFTDAFADDVRMHIAGPAELPFSGRWEGRDRVLDAIRSNFSHIDDQRPVVETVVAQGDTVVVVFDEVGRVKSTGRPYRVRCVQMFTFRDGKLAQMRQVATTAPAEEDEHTP